MPERLDLEIHTAHAAHSAATLRHAAASVLLRHFGHHGFSGDSTRRQSFSTRCSRRPSTRATSCTGTFACRFSFSSRDQRGFRFANARRRPTTNKPPEAGLSISCVGLNQLVNRRGDARTPLGSKASLQILDAGKSCCSFRSARARVRQR